MLPSVHKKRPQVKDLLTEIALAGGDNKSSRFLPSSGGNRASTRGSAGYASSRGTSRGISRGGSGTTTNGILVTTGTFASEEGLFSSMKAANFEKLDFDSRSLRRDLENYDKQRDQVQEQLNEAAKREKRQRLLYSKQAKAAGAGGGGVEDDMEALGGLGTTSNSNQRRGDSRSNTTNVSVKELSQRLRTLNAVAQQKLLLYDLHVEKKQATGQQRHRDHLIQEMFLPVHPNPVEVPLPLFKEDEERKAIVKRMELDRRKLVNEKVAKIRERLLAKQKAEKAAAARANEEALRLKEENRKKNRLILAEGMRKRQELLKADKKLKEQMFHEAELKQRLVQERKAQLIEELDSKWREQVTKKYTTAATSRDDGGGDGDGDEGKPRGGSTSNKDRSCQVPRGGDRWRTSSNAGLTGLRLEREVPLDDPEAVTRVSISECEQKGLCTFVATAANGVKQNMYSCETCADQSLRYCQKCADVCHKSNGHRTKASGQVKEFCRCGTSGNCSATPTRKKGGGSVSDAADDELAELARINKQMEELETRQQQLKGKKERG